MADFLYSSIFGDLTKNVQVRFDTASEMGKRLFNNVVFDKFLDWDVPTIGLDFEEIIGQYNISVAAPTIGDNSKDTTSSPLRLARLSTFRNPIWRSYESINTHIYSIIGNGELRNDSLCASNEYPAR